jgi:hypothetical protein
VSPRAAAIFSRLGKLGYIAVQAGPFRATGTAGEMVISDYSESLGDGLRRHELYRLGRRVRAGSELRHAYLQGFFVRAEGGAL